MSICNDWILRHRKKKTTEFCSLVKGFGNFYGKKVAVKQVTKDELDDENIC